MKGLGARLAAPLLVALLLGCSDGTAYRQAICALVDVSGTYADQRATAVRILKREVLPAMVPGDTLVVIRVDGESYDQENVAARMTLDARPSRANAQKLALARRLDALAEDGAAARHTDLPGAMMLGAEHLRETPAGSRVLVVMSDLAEDLPDGARRQLSEDEFRGIRVVALNVKQLRRDRADPSAFRRRLADWETRVRRASATSWDSFVHAGRLPAFLATARDAGGTG